MFTTGVHGWLYGAAGCYGIAWALYTCRQPAAGRAALAVGFLLQGLYLIGRGWLGDVFIPNSIVEGPFFLPWCLALIALFQSLAQSLAQSRTKQKAAMPWVMALVVIFSVLSVFYAKGMIPPTPKKLSVWALLFFMSESIAHALFYTAALYAFLGIIRKEITDSFHGLLVWGFIAYTVAQVTGALWCFVGWGNTFSWGARHLGSAAIWTFFAASLHLQFIPNWKRKNAFMVIAGALLVFYISYGHYFKEMHFQRVGG
jgi:hypothetical protein